MFVNQMICGIDSEVLNSTSGSQLPGNGEMTRITVFIRFYGKRCYGRRGGFLAHMDAFTPRLTRISSAQSDPSVSKLAALNIRYCISFVPTSRAEAGVSEASFQAS